MEKEQTFYQELKAKGYTRRQFLKFCGIMGAMLGLHQTGIAQVDNALQTKPRKPVLWFHFQECTCCSESFLRSSHPLVGQILLEMISLDYSDTLMAASGFQAEEVRTRSMKENWGKYIMIVEGSIPLGNPGYCTIAGHSAKQVFDEAAHGASAIIAWGNCASSGCIQGAYPNPTDTKPVHKIISGKPVINVQGCPPIADVMAGIITYIMTFDRLPELDIGAVEQFRRRGVLVDGDEPPRPGRHYLDAVAGPGSDFEHVARDACRGGVVGQQRALENEVVRGFRRNALRGVNLRHVSGF